MNEQQINEDRQNRVAQCKTELEAILAKYQLSLTAEDMIGQHTKMHIEIQFVDIKKYDAPIAQPINPTLDDIMGPNDPIGKSKKK